MNVTRTSDIAMPSNVTLNIEHITINKLEETQVSTRLFTRYGSLLRERQRKEKETETLKKEKKRIIR